MKSNTKIASLIFLAFLSFSLVLNISKKTYAASSATINATIRVNVCGDGLIGGEEDCDNTDLGNKTCKTFGYESGTLTCDPSCSFDYIQCSESSEEDDTDNSEDEVDTAVETLIETESTLRPSSYTRVFEVTELPAVLKVFDEDGDNKISIKEVTASAKKWYQSWKEYTATNDSNDAKECDLNTDNTCTLADFSILMYHIDN